MGSMGSVVTLVSTTAGRSSGVPRLVRQGDDLILVWVEESSGKAGSSRLRAARFPAAAIPRSADGPSIGASAGASAGH
jgi:hypothetical protein